MALCGSKPKVTTILWYIVFSGFAINYMLRVNINIAIVSMVQPRIKNPSNVHFQASECFAERSSVVNATSNASNLTTWPKDDEEELKFAWDEYQQGLVLGAFFWFHWLTQVPGGILARKFGTKLVFGLSNWVPCLLGFIIPIAAKIDFRCLVLLRFLQGVVAGFAWPSMHNLSAAWVPPNERSKFMTAYIGSSVGAAITYPMCGWLISLYGWPSVFYTTGLLGTIWFCTWWLLVFDTPAQHPSISLSERQHIEDGIGQSKATKKIATPWKNILLSGPAWMNIIAQWGNIWGLFTLMTQAPTYFKYIHGWGIGMTGLLSGAPHVCRIIAAYVTGVLCDWLLQRNLMSRSGVRKLATAICCIGQGLFVFGLAFSGCNNIASVIFLALATACSGAVSSGALASFIDLSPNFASIMVGISNTITVAPGIISPIIVGALTYNNQTVGQWQIVFLITAAMSTGVGIWYVFCASSELQPWNDVTAERELDVFHIKQDHEKASEKLLTDGEKPSEPNDKVTNDVA